MERNRMKRLLRSTCVQIETRFPGTLAEFEDFASPRPAFAGEGYLHVEVFDCKSVLKDKIQRFVDRIALSEFCARGLALSVLIWDEGETDRYFREDVEHIKRHRSVPDTECPAVATSWQSVAEHAPGTRLDKLAVPLRESSGRGYQAVRRHGKWASEVALLEQVQFSVRRAVEPLLGQAWPQDDVFVRYQTATTNKVRVA